MSFLIHNLFLLLPTQGTTELKLLCLSHVTILYKKNRADKRKKRSSAYFFLVNAFWLC
jgi:hypothetical protein